MDKNAALKLLSQLSYSQAPNTTTSSSSYTPPQLQLNFFCQPQHSSSTKDDLGPDWRKEEKSTKIFCLKYLVLDLFSREDQGNPESNYLMESSVSKYFHHM